MANKAQLLEKVQKYLDEDEKTELAIFGLYEIRVLGEKGLNEAVFLATNKRVVLYAAGLFKEDIEFFPYERVTSCEMNKAPLGNRVTVFTANNQGIMTLTKDKDLDSFVALVRSKIGKNRLDSASTTDIPEQIKKLAELKEAGILSEEEFEKKKTSLLARI